MIEEDDSVPPVAPEEGGNTSEELAYRLRQQKLTSELGRKRDADPLLPLLS